MKFILLGIIVFNSIQIIRNMIRYDRERNCKYSFWAIYYMFSTVFAMFALLAERICTIARTLGI